MNAVTVIIYLLIFLLGFLVGWLIEWRLDLGYWRTYFEEESEAEEAASVMVLPPAPPAQLLPPEESLLVQTLRDQLTQREADLTELRSQHTDREREWREREDAAREAAERQALAMIEQLNTNEAQWRETASARESELSEEARRLRTQVEELLAARNEVEAEWRHELARREAQWQESKEAELSALRQENDRLRGQAADLEGRLGHYQASHPDELMAISGISPKIQDDLRRAGIHSYVELAARTPDELHGILNPPKWRRLPYEAWIAQARQLVAGLRTAH